MKLYGKRCESIRCKNDGYLSALGKEYMFWAVEY